MTNCLQVSSKRPNQYHQEHPDPHHDINILQMSVKEQNTPFYPHHLPQDRPLPPVHPTYPMLYTVEMGNSHMPSVSPYGQDRRHTEEVTEQKEHEYQEIGEILRVPRTCDTKNIVKNKSEESDYKHKATETAHSKASLLYGLITAREVAKYRPCTQDIIVR